jgi:hypothetical protein
MEEQQEIRAVVREVMEEYFKGDHAEERKQRESLEQRVNELVAQNQKARATAEEADRGAAVRAELQRLGVAKLDLAYRAIKDEIHRSEDGKLVAQGGAEMRDYVMQFVNENPELLPARLTGGSGASAGQRNMQSEMGVDLERIRPGMDPEELERVRQEISRVASQTLRGL